MGKRPSQILKHSIRVMLTVIVVIVANFLSCHNIELGTPVVSDYYHALGTPQEEQGRALAGLERFVTERHFTFAPPSSLQAADRGAVRVKPVLTPWSEPWSHEKVCRAMDRILTISGVESPSARVRMIAHAVVSSGWRQNVWHYNAWGVKRGEWDGPWYQMSTMEVDKTGHETIVYNEQWRAFSSWREAVQDYVSRITRKSPRPSYRKAARHLSDKDYRSDKGYWDALGEGNYYTTRKFSSQQFSALCFRVRSELRDS